MWNVLGWAAALVALGWLFDRLTRGAQATPLRERTDARQLGGAVNGIGRALPFLGRHPVDLPPAPPAVDYEPEPGPHTIVLHDHADLPSAPSDPP